MKAISFLSASIPWNFHKAGSLVTLRVPGTRRKLRSFGIRATERSEISTPKRLAIYATSCGGSCEFPPTSQGVVIEGEAALSKRRKIQKTNIARSTGSGVVQRFTPRRPRSTWSKVNRRKVEPAAGAEQLPISLDDMPTDFTLQFSPSLTVAIHPSASENLWRWLQFKGREWWMWLKGWGLILTTGNAPPSQPFIQLTVTSHHAQSLAWTVTEGMPFLLRRTSLPAS